MWREVWRGNTEQSYRNLLVDTGRSVYISWGYGTGGREVAQAGGRRGGEGRGGRDDREAERSVSGNSGHACRRGADIRRSPKDRG